MKLRKLSSGLYQTEDGRFNIERDEHRENDCECIHCLDGRVWHCRSNGVRVEIAWIVWNNEEDDYAEGTGPLEFDTKREAVAYLTDHYERTVSK